MSWSFSQILKVEPISAKESMCFFELNKLDVDGTTVVTTETITAFISNLNPTEEELTSLGQKLAAEKTEGDAISLPTI